MYTYISRQITSDKLTVNFFLFKTNKHVCLHSNYRLHHIHLENLRDGPYEDSPTDLIRW